MRVAILTQYFEPEPVTRLAGLTRRLVDSGHSVQVLTALPNWPEGRYYRGYGPSIVRREERLGARVIRTYVWPYHGSVTWRRLLNYGTFAVSAMIGARHLHRFDVLYVYHPPLTISLPAFLISKRCKVPFVYDVQDIWPEAGLAANVVKPGLLYRLMSSWASWSYARATRITVIAQDFAGVLSRQGVPADKISVIPNWADDSIYFPRPANGMREQLGLADSAFVVMYAGNLGSTHGVDYILNAADQLRNHGEISFLFAGVGPEYERMLAAKEQLGLPNVRFLGYIQPVNMSEMLAAADLMVIHLRRSASGAVSLPSRMLTYMACARPMLVASEGAPRRLVEETGCGAVCEPEDPAAIAEAILSLASQPERLRQMGRKGRNHYIAEFCEEVVTDRLVKLIATVAGSA
jgi:colanic acid biosynthesis glycosyl transferase WcaI